MHSGAVKNGCLPLVLRSFWRRVGCYDVQPDSNAYQKHLHQKVQRFCVLGPLGHHIEALCVRFIGRQAEIPKTHRSKMAGEPLLNTGAPWEPWAAREADGWGRVKGRVYLSLNPTPSQQRLSGKPHQHQTCRPVVHQLSDPWIVQVHTQRPVEERGISAGAGN